MAASALLALRFAKLLAVSALVAGTVGAFVPRDLEDRKRAAYFLAAPGLAVAWTIGLAMALGQHFSPVAAWIAVAAIASTISTNVVLWSVAREGRRSWLAAIVSIAGLVIAVASMVYRPGLS